MQCILIKAERPPIALLICGTEGGMQRALGVSYDWTTGTLYRETVLRLETPILDNVCRIPRARIGLKRPKPDVIGRRMGV